MVSRYFCARNVGNRVDQLNTTAQVYFGSSGFAVQTTTTLPFNQSAIVPSSRRKPRSYPSGLSAMCQSVVAQLLIGKPFRFAYRSQ